MNCSTPGLPIHHQLLEPTQTHVHWVSDAIQPSHPLLAPSPPARSLSQHQGLFSWVSSSHEVAKVLEFQLQHQSFQWTPRIISFRMDWLDLLAVQGTPKSLLQHHSSKASILWRSAFFIVQLSHPYMTTGFEIPYDYTVEVTNRFKFKGLVLIDRVPEELWMKVCDTVQEAVIKTIPKKKKCKKAKWLCEEALQIAEKRREVKGKGEKERYTHLNAEFQRLARRDKKTFLSDQCK